MIVIGIRALIFKDELQDGENCMLGLLFAQKKSGNGFLEAVFIFRQTKEDWRSLDPSSV